MDSFPIQNEQTPDHIKSIARTFQIGDRANIYEKSL